MEQKINFQNSKGDKLVGILNNPTNNLDQQIMIIAHGFSRDKDGKSKLNAESLAENNISSFRFDFWGHGESEGDFENITVSEGVDDVLQAIKYIKGLGFKKIGLIGRSYGGMCSLMAASKTNDINLLVLVSAVSDFVEMELFTRTKKELQDWKDNGYLMYERCDGEKFRLNFSFYEDFKNNNGYKAAGKIKIPTLIIHGDKDEIVPVSQSIKTSKLITNSQLEIIEGCDHRYSNPDHLRLHLELINKFIINSNF